MVSLVYTYCPNIKRLITYIFGVDSFTQGLPTPKYPTQDIHLDITQMQAAASRNQGPMSLPLLSSFANTRIFFSLPCFYGDEIGVVQTEVVQNYLELLCAEYGIYF